VLVCPVLGSDRNNNTINWPMRSVDRQLLEDRQYDDPRHEGIALADADDAVLA
jgi:hypothetical protein